MSFTSVDECSQPSLVPTLNAQQYLSTNEMCNTASPVLLHQVYKGHGINMLSSERRHAGPHEQLKNTLFPLFTDAFTPQFSQRSRPLFGENAQQFLLSFRAAESASHFITLPEDHILHDFRIMDETRKILLIASRNGSLAAESLRLPDRKSVV